MRIDKIKKMKNGKYKLLIDGDNDIVTYDEVILKNNLLNNSEIDEELLLKLNADTDYYSVYNKTINYIKRRLRSEKEIILYLEKNKVNKKEKNKIISELKSHGLVNDYTFAKAYIADKMNLSSSGPNKIKKELYKHNIEESVIEELIDKLDDSDIYEKLSRLINKKILANNKYSKYQLKSKILNNFITLGYSVDMINDIFDEHFVEDNNIIKKEYEKTYQKLKRKYQGDELYFKIRQNLYQRGFQSDEINEIINSNFE
ncbi:MAG TPA: hypothetical protein GXZ63_02595 [Mollicutes bacterium]|jgi:regulatory protein|nr:hypothetical protein [Mollicutes bacterium]